MTTGAAHWELLSRARAVDNQVNFVLLLLLHHVRLRSMLPLLVQLETPKLAMLLGVIRPLSSEAEPDISFLELH